MTLRTFLALFLITSTALVAHGAPKIEIESTLVELPEAVWKPMTASGSWKVMPGQQQWSRLVVTTDRADQAALVGAWFGGNASGKDGSFLPLVSRALNEKKGVDLLSAPKMTTHSQQRAKIEIVREFRYATAWKPGAKKEDPWVPAHWATRNTGVTIDLVPTLKADGKIGLEVTPQIVEFEGFEDLGHGRKKPIFSERKVQTDVTLRSGQTVILGGATREDKQIVEDSVPVLGDVPLLGRLFRSRHTQVLKRSLVILVTPRIRAGKP